VGGIVTITDATGAALDTADTITTVTLTNAGVTIINSSALSVLNLSSTGTAANTVTINGQSTTTETELDLNLSGLFGLITATTAGLADTDYATVNVNVSAGSIVGGLSVTDATAVNISGGGSASLGTVTTAAAAVITSTNTGGISLSVGVVDAAFVGTNSSGNDTVTMFAASTADHTTGNGDDTVIMTAGFVGAGGSVDAGGGDDTISVTVAAAVTAGIEDQISNFEVLSITATSAALAGSVNLANWDDINYVTSAGTGAFALGVSGFTSGGTFELTGGLDVAGAATLTGAFTGLTDEFTVALTSAGALANAGAVFLGGIETLNIELTDTDGFTVAHSSTLNVTDASTTTVNISGDTGLTLTGLTALTTLDASGVTAGGVIFTAVNAASLTGGDGNDQLTGSALADIIDGGDGDDALVGAAGADDISGGDGVDVITGGLGADDMTGGAGADVFEFSTDGSVAGTSLDVISDFNVGGADRIGFGAAGLLLLVEANGTAAGTDVDTTAGGLITFAAADDTLAEKITAIQADTQLDAVNSVAFFEDGGSTYLYYAGAALGNTDDQLIELDGVTGLTAITILNSDVTIA
jgi:Ca2+-binding RTX toxin-like protein